MRHFLAPLVLLIALALPQAGQSAPSYLMLGGRGTSGTPGGGGSGTCTDGVDCYCDTASTNVLCEDFEEAGYYENVSNGPIAGSGSPFDRGGDSLWFDTYGSNASMGFRSSDPSPTLGTACGYSQCNGIKEYCSSAQGALAGVSSDCWGPGVNSGSCVDFQRSGDFDAEDGTLTLTGGSGVTADVGAGNTHMADRIPVGSTCGITGDGKDLTGGPYTQVGVTRALAFASNLADSHVTVRASDSGAEPWKFEEWGSSAAHATGFGEHWALWNTGSGSYDQFPYRGFVFWDQVGTNDQCDTAVAAVTKNAPATGSQIGCVYGCSGDPCVVHGSDPAIGVKFGADPSRYSKATDFPDGTWHCPQGWISGLGTTNVKVKYWHDGTLIFDISGLDGTHMKSQNYVRFAWNNYANANAYGTTSETSWRYMDNMVVSTGASPISCAEIGF